MVDTDYQSPLNVASPRFRTDIAAWLVVIVGSVLAKPVTSLAVANGDRIERVTFASRAMGTNKHYSIVLPSTYQPGGSDWPVLYMLHGRGRTDRSLIDETTTRQAILDAPFVTVCPNGEDGWYLDSPTKSQNKYAKLLEDTIHDAENHFGLSRRPEKRAIAGWSMGGYGCVRYAEAHPKSFSVVAPILGLLDFPRTGLPKGQSYVLPQAVFGTDQTVWKELNPLHAADKLRGSDVLLITANRAFDRTMNENFRDRLRELEIRHEWKVLDGEHHFDVVKEALPHVIEHVTEQFDRADSARQNTGGVGTRR